MSHEQRSLGSGSTAPTVSDDLIAMLDELALTIVEALRFGVAVVNLVRPDGSLEVVSVAGDKDARRALLGTVDTAEIWETLLSNSEPWGRLRFADHLSEGADANSLTWVPDIKAIDAEDAWHPEDALFAPLIAADGTWLGILSVDLPHDGRRPNEASRQALEAFAMATALAIEHSMLRTRAEAAEEAKTRFLAYISHELRTPLTSMLGLGELLLDGDLEPEQRTFAETMHRSGLRLLAIVNEFLDFSRAEAGFLVTEARPFDLRSLLDQLAAEFAPLAAKKGLLFEVETGADIPSTVQGDDMRVAQILQNLMGNAVKFTHQGFVRLRVSLHSDSNAGPALHFAVEDSGVGFSVESQGDLFQPFTQADKSVTRAYGGTGLGLAISKQLAELMGGAIRAESHLGEGSTFTFILPGEAHPPALT